jgi:shikimate 5-dehydrogenase
MVINSETKLYGSFSIKAGNLGCKLFNEAFQHLGINAIYKSFSIRNIEKAVEAAVTLNFSAFAVSMPFKMEVLRYVDSISDECKTIGAANTIINNNGVLTAYNTDVYAASRVFNMLKTQTTLYNKVYILGNGGYSKAVQYAVKHTDVIKDLNLNIITRKNWNDIKNIKNAIIYNCTPVENIEIDKSNFFIDCITTTDWGKRLSMWQASRQFEMYTGQEYPFEIN